MSPTVRTVATRRMFNASGSEMKRHFVVVRLKTKQTTTLNATKIWQYLQQQRQAGVEGFASLKAQVEARQQRKRRRQRVVPCDQVVASGQMRKTRHSSGRPRSIQGIRIVFRVR